MGPDDVLWILSHRLMPAATGRGALGFVLMGLTPRLRGTLEPLPGVPEESEFLLVTVVMGAAHFISP